MADSSFLPEDVFPDDLDPAATLDVLDERLTDPTTPAPDLVVTDQAPDPLGRSWAFDFVSNRFVAHASGVAQTRGIATLRQWIEKCLRTDRGAHPIHGDGYGMVRPFDIIGMPLAAISSDELSRRIEDALTYHPMITGIDDFVMDYDPVDTVLNVAFSVSLADNLVLAIDNLQLP